mmetsp:Transcript_69885/g.186140  ORF Transcript_69885/g.186140 Transcript_69885/m.186140 type:complete len:255 (-) Transcript_69885:793-1557(-)
MTTLPLASEPFCAASFSRSTPISLLSDADQHMLCKQRSASSEMKALVSAAFLKRVGTNVSSSLSTALLKFCIRSCKQTSAFLASPLRRLSQIGITWATSALTAGATASAECLAARRKVFKASNCTDHWLLSLSCLPRSDNHLSFTCSRIGCSSSHCKYCSVVFPTSTGRSAGRRRLRSEPGLEPNSCTSSAACPDDAACLGSLLLVPSTTICDGASVTATGFSRFRMLTGTLRIGRRRGCSSGLVVSITKAPKS